MDPLVYIAVFAAWACRLISPALNRVDNLLGKPISLLLASDLAVGAGKYPSSFFQKASGYLRSKCKFVDMGYIKIENGFKSMTNELNKFHSPELTRFIISILQNVKSDVESALKFFGSLSPSANAAKDTKGKVKEANEEKDSKKVKDANENTKTNEDSAQISQNVRAADICLIFFATVIVLTLWVCQKAYNSVTGVFGRMKKRFVPEL